MNERIVTIGKRPANTTGKEALELHQTKTLQEIGDLWGISRQRVAQIIKAYLAKEDRENAKQNT